MLPGSTSIVALSWVILCLMPLPCCASEPGTGAADEPELIMVQVKVTDKKTGEPVDDANVMVKWGEGEAADDSSETTDSQGIARINDVPRGKVVIRVIARGYKTEPRRVALKSESQPIKIELNKEHVEETTPPPPPGRSQILGPPPLLSIAAPAM